MYVACAQASFITPNSSTRMTADAEEDAADADLAGPELRQPLGHVRPERQAAAAHDDHDEDHEERGHAVEPGDQVLVEEVL